MSRPERVVLKEFVNDDDFIEKMNRAFSDLRADYELSMDADEEKILELKETHVDVKNQLSDLIAYSTTASGIVSGLRGTGKTHILLLARQAINENFYNNKAERVLCIYLNIKRLNFPTAIDQEIFNRIFSIFMYDEMSKQLKLVLSQLENPDLLSRLLGVFNHDKKRLIQNLREAIVKLTEFKSVVRNGNEAFGNLSIGTIGEEEYTQSLISLVNSIEAKLGFTSAALQSNISSSLSEEVSQRISSNNTYLKYLNINSVRDQFLNLMQLLQIKAITFYVDEWEKIYYKPVLQEYLSFFIDRIIDNPLYFWISIVPYRGGLHYLDNGADLQHYINLDENLVFENSRRDKEICINYFREFINKRLYFYFDNEAINIDILFNNSHNFETLILASMGNSRDFGTMLLKCWSEYQSYRTGSLLPGRPYQYISESMVIEAIKNNGEKKLSNIKDNSRTLQVWNSLELFCLGKKSSHLAIEESKTNIECLSRVEYSDLIYHRLLHFRKGHVPHKDSNKENKLSIYALNYSTIYDLHSKDRRMTYVTEYSIIHDRVRRYIYDPTQIIKRIQIEEGEIYPCSSCGESINITKMVGAWNKNSCPYCDGEITKNR
ncbi:hypothetical protein [Hydrogenoanaerobacterium sp.]|uniref:hypothetical protein n=1 Tax=Hydrogenoanaerobacterium sp. TaxID=2953763 RepID=UPI00289815DB|nr:hypothetical protein [Hydrogenoanaerobacterium sp.]